MKVSINKHPETTIKTYSGSVRINGSLSLFTIIMEDNGSSISHKIEWDDIASDHNTSHLHEAEAEITAQFSNVMSKTIEFEL